MSSIAYSSDFSERFTTDVVAFLLIGGLGYANFYNIITDPSTTALILLGTAFVFKFIMLCITGEIKEIIGTVLGTMLIAIIAGFIPVIGVLLVALLVLVNISSALMNIRFRMSDAIITSLMYYSLYFPNWYGTDKAIALGFFITCLIVLRIKIYSEEATERGLLDRYALAFLSPPLILISIISLISALKSSFNTSVSSRSVNVTRPQAVSSHFRANGTFVDSYTRSINTTVTQSVTNITPGTGAITSSLSNVGLSNNSVLNNFRNRNFYRVLIVFLCLFAGYVYFTKKDFRNYSYEASNSQTQVDNIADNYSQQANEPEQLTSSLSEDQPIENQESPTLGSEPETIANTEEDVEQPITSANEIQSLDTQNYKYFVDGKIVFYISDDGHSVDAEAKPKTDEVLDILSKGKKIGISGYVKDTDDSARQERFANDLAEATKDYLIKIGANAQQIELIKPENIYKDQDGQEVTRVEVFIIE